MDNSIKIISIIVAGVLALAILVGVFFVPEDYTNTVQGSGESSLEVMPDLVSMHFTIQTRGETSEEATLENNAILSSLTVNLEDIGILGDEIKTTNFNVYQDYTWDDGERKANGFVAYHYVEVEISADDTGKISDVIEAGVNAGVSVSYINFELSDELESQTKAEALRLAAQDAQTKASAIAEGLGMELGKLVSVSDSNFNYYSTKAYAMEDEDMGSTSSAEIATSINPSEQTVYASVTATYKLK